MLYATNRFPGDGVTTQYEISFVGGYLQRSHVKAYVENMTTRIRTPVTVSPGQFLNDTTLTGFAPVPVGSMLVIYRETPRASLLDFTTTSRITEANLDLSARQGLYCAAEALDFNYDLVQASNEIAGIADLVQAGVAQTAANVVLTNADVVTTNNHRLAAAGSATASANSATASANSATASDGSATAALGSKTAAATSATNAAASATNSNTSAGQSAGYASTAQSAQAASSGSATAAAGSATTASNKATEASGHAATASTKATTATNEAAAASSHATNASLYATNASTSAVNAANSATAASNSAASAASAAAGAVADLARGMCCKFVMVSSSQCRLQRHYGTTLLIGGVARTIPSAGVNIGVSGFTGQLQYVYAYWTGSTVALEATTSGPARDDTYGYVIKGGDATRTLVGAFTRRSLGFADSPTQRDVVSLYHQGSRVLVSALGASAAAANGTSVNLTSVTFTALGTSLDFNVGGQVACTGYARVFCVVGGLLSPGAATMQGTATVPLGCLVARTATQLGPGTYELSGRIQAISADATAIGGEEAGWHLNALLVPDQL